VTQPNVTAPSAQYIGLDLGDRRTHLCGLDDQRQVVERSAFPTTREAVRAAFADRPPTRVVLEVGSQSPWLSRLLKELGHDVLVADARRVKRLQPSGGKTDRRDAEFLARLFQGNPELMGSVHHRGEQAQADVTLLRSRDLCVSMRTMLIQSTKSAFKAFGLSVPKGSPAAFHRAARPEVPEPLKPALEPLLDLLEAVQRRIRDFDRQAEEVAAARYPETEALRAINGVGPITSLAYVLTIDDPKRFAKSRAVGSYLGLCPRLEMSGNSTPELPISKAGNPYMRRLLIQSAQYILGPFGQDSDLRRFGLRLCERGGKAAKRRAVTAVALELAVLMHRLWVSGEPYEPLRNSQPA